MDRPELIVIGGGPGGLAAALAAAGFGVSSLILDENPKPGGRIFGQPDEGLTPTDHSHLGAEKALGLELLAGPAGHRDLIRIQSGSEAFGLFPGRILAWHSQGRARRLEYGPLVIAPGAYERPVPFPGWTLPGVMQAGGVQSLVKLQKVLPGRRFLFVGSGPLQLVVANQVISAGGEVAALAEAGRSPSSPGLLAGLAANPAQAWSGLKYLAGLRLAGVPILRRHVIVKALGRDRLEAAVIARADGDWRPVGGTERTIRADALAVGYGLIPSAELTRLAGCDHRFRPEKGGWLPIRNPEMETTISGVWAVGDGAGVGGGPLAALEGRLAGLAVARRLGRLDHARYNDLRRPLLVRMARLARLRRALDPLSTPRPGLWDLADDGTVICRCESITLGRIKEMVALGVTDLNEIKRLTRSGMGRCQGRMCGPSIQHIVARLTGADPAGVDYLGHRPPVKPVKLGLLADLPGDFSRETSW